MIYFPMFFPPFLPTLLGMGGVSLLLMERDMPGVSIRRQKTQGWLTSGTAYIVMEDVKVSFGRTKKKKKNLFPSY